jgi:hypothetical protein
MLEQALSEGLRRGLITRSEVKQAKARDNLMPMMKQLFKNFK